MNVTALLHSIPLFEGLSEDDLVALSLALQQRAFKLPTSIDDSAFPYHAIGGLVMDQLGRVPTLGDSFEWMGLKVEVMDMDGNRVDRVLCLTIGATLPVQSAAKE